MTVAETTEHRQCTTDQRATDQRPAKQTAQQITNSRAEQQGKATKTLPNK